VNTRFTWRMTRGKCMPRDDSAARVQMRSPVHGEILPRASSSSGYRLDAVHWVVCGDTLEFLNGSVTAELEVSARRTRDSRHRVPSLKNGRPLVGGELPKTRRAPTIPMAEHDFATRRGHSGPAGPLLDPARAVPRGRPAPGAGAHAPARTGRALTGTHHVRQILRKVGGSSSMRGDERIAGIGTSRQRSDGHRRGRCQFTW
jgi:hypothetical protein